MLYRTILPNRGVLKITGKDRAAFLQGLITNDVHKITTRQAIYAALLSPQGKFQYDLFIATALVDGEEAWLVECDQDRIDMLMKRLSLYKLRSDVSIENVSDNFIVSVLFGSSFLKKFSTWQPGEARATEGGVLFVDPRLADLGGRAIVPSGDIGNGEIDTTSWEAFWDFWEMFDRKPASFKDYDLHRLKLGVPDGSRDVLVDRGILLECGFDELNAIDWNKGCYMGQELTARTRYRGLVRKRLIPVRIQGETPAFQSPILQEGTEVGEIRTALQEWGIAMIRLEALSKPLPFHCGNATLTPHIPQWMRLPSLTDEG